MFKAILCIIRLAQCKECKAVPFELVNHGGRLYYYSIYEESSTRENGHQPINTHVEPRFPPKHLYIAMWRRGAPWNVAAGFLKWMASSFRGL